MLAHLSLPTMSTSKLGLWEQQIDALSVYPILIRWNISLPNKKVITLKYQSDHIYQASELQKILHPCYNRQLILLNFTKNVTLNRKVVMTRRKYHHPIIVLHRFGRNGRGYVSQRVLCNVDKQNTGVLMDSFSAKFGQWMKFGSTDSMRIERCI